MTRTKLSALVPILLAAATAGAAGATARATVGYANVFDRHAPFGVRPGLSVQFTIGEETHDKLRRLQALLRRELSDGDPGAIFDRALGVLLDKVDRAKLAAAAGPQPLRPIRSETDRAHESAPPSRQIPREVKRTVWQRDGGRPVEP